MNALSFPVWLPWCLLVLAPGPAAVAEQPKAEPQVQVGQPLVREVTDYADFTGRTDASVTVEIRTRVTGYLNKVVFKDGAEVQRGELLFEIDPRPYQAELARAEAGLVLAEARLKRAEVDHKRATALLPKQAISREEFDKIVADRDEAEAGRLVARATIAIAKVNLDYTRISAPISGRISRRFIDAGNLVKADDTLLTTIVTQDPIYAYFEVDERTLLRVRRGIKGQAGLQVGMGLADEMGFPRRGTIDFADNRLDPKAGTLRLRAVFANPDSTLLPGLLVRVRLAVGEPAKALLVPEQAVAVERGEKYLFVVGDQNILERRLVEVGAGHEGLRVVKDGLRATDWVVLSKVEGLRAGMTVKPEKAAITEPLPKPEERSGKDSPTDPGKRQR